MSDHDILDVNGVGFSVVEPQPTELGSSNDWVHIHVDVCVLTRVFWCELQITEIEGWIKSLNIFFFYHLIGETILEDYH